MTKLQAYVAEYIEYLLHAVRNRRDSLLYEDGQLFHGSFPTLLLQIDAISKPGRQM